MEGKPFELIESMKKIIKNYRKIYTIVFHYSVFIISFLIATFIAYGQSQRTDLKIYEEPQAFIVHKVELKKTFENFIQQNIDNSALDIYVLQWSLQATWKLLQSTNNLLTYKGYIVPRFFSLYSTVPLLDISQLTWNYDIRNLETFAQNVLFTPITDDSEPFKRAQLPIVGWVVNQFNISCIFKPKFMQWTCDHYMDNFIEHLFIYDLPKDYAGLQKISTRLSDKWWYKKEFCSAMKKYILYSNDTSVSLEPIFKNCGVQGLQGFQMLQGFIELQNQFKSNYTENNTYFEEKLNLYKLVSLQQIIYNDLREKRVNDRILLPYLWFIENMLKKDVMPPFYKDLTYWFHNYYLKSHLSDPAFSNKKELIDKVIAKINQINIGSSLIGYIWLQDQIQNKNLLLKVADDSNIFEHIQLSTEELFKKLNNLSFIAISDYTIAWTRISIEWVMNLQQYKKGEQKVSFDAVLQSKNNDLIVQKIVIDGHVTLTKIVQSLVEKNERSMTNVYQYLNENSDFYVDQEWELDLCDIVKSKVSSRFVIKCSDDYIYLQKQEYGAPIKYEFTIQDYQIRSLKISDKELQKQIDKEIKWLETNKITLPNLIQFIFDYKKIEASDVPQKTIQEALIIVEKFQKYMDVEPIKIYKENGNLFVKFQLEWVNYKVIYNTLTNDIGPLYFDNVFYRTDKEVPVKNFSISLDDEHKTIINSFVLDPLGYIESINKNAYKAYIKYK